MPHQTSPFLRLALRIDAAMTGAMGLLLVAFAGEAAPPLGLPEALLQWAGAALIPFVAFVGWLSIQENPPRALAWLVVAANALWAIDSILILLLGWIEPTTLGTIFVIGQAAVGALFAELQIIGLKRTPSYA